MQRKIVSLDILAVTVDWVIVVTLCLNFIYVQRTGVDEVVKNSCCLNLEPSSNFFVISFAVILLSFPFIYNFTQLKFRVSRWFVFHLWAGYEVAFCPGGFLSGGLLSVAFWPVALCPGGLVRTPSMAMWDHTVLPTKVIRFRQFQWNNVLCWQLTRCAIFVQTQVIYIENRTYIRRIDSKPIISNFI